MANVTTMEKATNPTTNPITIQLNEYGKIAHNQWLMLPERFPTFELDVFIIMPNHMHSIIVLNEQQTDNHTHHQSGESIDNQIIDPNGNPMVESGQTRRFAPTIGNMVGAYKSIVANACLNQWKSDHAGENPVPQMGKLWQRNYYEHIIRDETAYQRIAHYIINNPAKWRDDKFYIR